MSKFPITGLSSDGNRVIEKSKIDNVDYFDNLDALGPNWGEAFVKPMNMAFSGSIATKYKLHNVFYKPSINQSYGVASTGTDFFLCGSSSVRPSKYNIANDTWTEDSLAYNDYGSLYINVGAFGYGGNAYFYTNNPGMDTSVNFLEIKKYNPLANNWTTLTSLTGIPATVIYGFMGIADGGAYFMQMIKSSNPSYVPATFPSLYKYSFSSDTWANINVLPPLVRNDAATGQQGFDVMFRGNNSLGCNFSDTEMLIHTRGFLEVHTTTCYAFDFLNTLEVYKFNSVDNTFTKLCRFKDGYINNGPVSGVDYALQRRYSDTRIFYNMGIVYLWCPLWGGLVAYSIENQKQYHVPIRSANIVLPLICEENGKVYMFCGLNESYNPQGGGIIIDLNSISAFLNKKKTVAVSSRSFN